MSKEQDENVRLILVAVGSLAIAFFGGWVIGGLAMIIGSIFSIGRKR